MAQPLHASVSDASHPTSKGTLFGLPLGDLGGFGTLLIGVASGFLAFFATTFLAILVLLVWNSVTHANIDYAISYRWIGFPIGVVVLIFALSYLSVLWLKRKLHSA